MKIFCHIRLEAYWGRQTSEKEEEIQCWQHCISFCLSLYLLGFIPQRGFLPLAEYRGILTAPDSFPLCLETRKAFASVSASTPGKDSTVALSESYVHPLIKCRVTWPSSSLPFTRIKGSIFFPEEREGKIIFWIEGNLKSSVLHNHLLKCQIETH